MSSITVDTPAVSPVVPSTVTGFSTDERSGSLSPSRAGDFKQCPLLFRFRVVDRLAERPSSAAVRGTVVHRALEQVFDVPAPQRTVEHARSLLAPALAAVVEQWPEVSALFDDGHGDVDRGEGRDEPDGSGGGDAGSGRTAAGPSQQAWLAEAERLVGRWFELEDPTRLEPDGREVRVEHRVADDLVLRGIVDRVDVAPDGRIRIVDYKTGRAPSEAFEARALFQMKFYALLLWRTRGRVPARVQLVYVGGRGQTLPLDVDETQLAAFERTVLQLWQAIREAALTGDWRPSPSRMCGWCDHHRLCPAQGGTAPPLPPDALDRVLRPVPVQVPVVVPVEVPGTDEV